MAFGSELINRIRHFLSRSRFEDDLDDEIRFHLESRATELRASGLSQSEAVSKARREFGPYCAGR